MLFHSTVVTVLDGEGSGCSRNPKFQAGMRENANYKFPIKQHVSLIPSHTLWQAMYELKHSGAFNNDEGSAHSDLLD